MHKTIISVLILFPLLLVAGELSFPGTVKLGGELDKRVRLTEKRLQHQPFDLDLIVQDVARRPKLKRRFEEYEGDVSGRTLGSWSYMSRLLGEHPQKLDSIFEAILVNQKPGGFFGKDQQKIDWDYWGRQTFGHGRLLGGLVQYYLLTRDDRAKQAAEKLGDYFVAKIPQWSSAFADNPWSDHDDWVNWQDQQSNRRHFVKTHMTSILESLMMLHDVSPKQTYLDAGEKIVALFPEFGQYHSHSFMNTMVGMTMLYAKTGDHTLLSRLYDTYWQDIAKHSSPVDGGMREWFPDDHRTEGCSITDWVRLNLSMWKITRDAVYLDAAENAWYNALNLHQTANGAFGHGTCSAVGYENAYSEAWWCCTMHGLWAYADLVNFAAACSEKDVWFNFYTPMRFDLSIGGQEMNFQIETAYPVDGRVQISCTTKDAVQTTTHLRIPQWADTFSVTINGKKVAGARRKEVFTFSHEWKNGDVLRLDMPLALRIIDEHGNNILKRRNLGTQPVTGCFFYGPLLLGVNGRNNQRLPVEIHFDADKIYRIAADAAPFALDAHFMLPSVTKGSIEFEAFSTLTPISEITGSEDWTDEWKNFLRNGEKPISRPAVQIWQNIQIRK